MALTKFAKFCEFLFFDVIVCGHISGEVFGQLLLLQFIIRLIVAHCQFHFDFNGELVNFRSSKKRKSQTRFKQFFPFKFDPFTLFTLFLFFLFFCTVVKQCRAEKSTFADFVVNSCFQRYTVFFHSTIIKAIYQ